MPKSSFTCRNATWKRVLKKRALEKRVLEKRVLRPFWPFLTKIWSLPCSFEQGGKISKGQGSRAWTQCLFGTPVLGLGAKFQGKKVKICK